MRIVSFCRCDCGFDESLCVYVWMASLSPLGEQYWGMKLWSLATNSSCQLNVSWHDCNSLCMDRTQVGVFEKTNQICFGSFLQCENGRTLEPQICFEILRNFTNQSLKWKFPNQKISGFLVPSDFSKSNGSWAVAMRFFYTAGGGCGFASRLGGQLFAGGFAAGGFACSLLCPCHVELVV